MKFPKIKKKVKLFLLEEEGKISKKNMILTGAVLGGAALSLLHSVKPVSADGWSDQHYTIHDNALDVRNSVSPETQKVIGAKGVHNHHLSHASHHIHSSY